VNQNNPPKEPEDSQQDETRAQRSFATEEPNINSGDSYLGSRRPEADHDLDANAPQLSTHDAKRFSRIALTSAIVLGLLMACVVGLLIVRKSGSSTVDNAKSKEEKVVVPDTPESQAGDPAAMAPIPLYQAPAVGHKDAAPITDSASDEAAQRPREPTLMERRIGSAESGGSQAPAADPYVQAMLGGLGDKSGDMAKEQSSTQTTRAQFIANPDALLVRGTYLRCVLETRIVTDIKGFTSCIVTEPVYSLNGRKLLIPKGSKISGTYGTDANGPRVSVIWDRVITPNGVDVTMSSPGVDNLGGAGHPGDYNAHWGSRISSALMISLISDAFKYAGAKNGPPSTTVTNGIVTQEPFESNTARTMEQLANQALDRSISRPATVTINQGVVVNIYVAQDIDFSGVSAGI
jgi:type IV secretion system protein VirB10